MAIYPYVFKTLDEMTLEDKCHHLAAFNKITVEEFGGQDPEFPDPIDSDEMEELFKKHINGSVDGSVDGLINICGIAHTAYDWLQASDPYEMSDRFIQWQEDCVRKDLLVRLWCEGKDRFYDADQIREYLSKKGL